MHVSKDQIGYVFMKCSNYRYKNVNMKNIN